MFRIDTVLFTTINIGLLTVAAFVFGFASLRRQLKSEVETTLKSLLKNEPIKRRDYLRTKLNKEFANIEDIMKDLGSWFRKCIYGNLINLIIIIIYSYYSEIPILAPTLAIMVSLGTLICGVIMGVWVHKFKRVYDFDIKQQIRIAKRKADFAEKIIASKDYEIITRILDNL